MKNKRKNHLNQRVITVLMVLSIALIAFLTYRDILGYFFTAPDTLTLIDTSQIRSFRDIFRIFTEPLMNGTIFSGKFYRPISVLSYSLEYSIWQLNPFGYHLTNLMLHILVSVLVFFLIRFLTNGKQVTAWWSAIIFTTHPVLIENVPGIARRQDIMAALFIVLSLLLFLKHLYALSHKRSYLLFSVFFCALALGTKEIAIVLPPLIFIYTITFTFSAETSFKEKTVRAVKGCLPYFIVTFMYLAWRIYILQGIGGYVHSLRSGVFEVIQFLVEISSTYFVDLLYPVDFLRLNSLFSPFPTTFEQTGFLTALFALFIFLLLYRRAIFRIMNNNAKGVIKALKILLATVVILSLIGILVYPLISFFINQLIQQSYRGEGLNFLTDAMEYRDTYPVEHYSRKGRDLMLRLCLISLFFSAIFLIGIHQRDKIKSFFISSAHGKLMGFLLIWLLLPLGIYLLTQISPRSRMYVSVIPFSAILSIMLVESFQSTIRKIRAYFSSGSFYRSSLISSTPVSLIIPMIIAGLSVSLFAYSPLVRTYGEWEDSGNISSTFLHKLSEIVTELPNDAVIHIYNLPRSISSYKTRIPHAKTVEYLYKYSIKSWLNLTYPTNHMEIVIPGRFDYAVYPGDMDLEVKMEENNNVVINVIPGKQVIDNKQE